MKAWVPPLCEEPCIDGFYGANCLAECGKCGRGHSCNRVDGTCPEGCLPGYIPPSCTEQEEPEPDSMKVCEKHYYGANCEQACGHCVNDNCDAMTGLCVEGCTPGYHPLQCRKPCSEGWYGLNCAYKCGHCFDRMEICRYTDGLCMSGCEPDWFGLDCNFRSYEEYKAALVAMGQLSGSWKVTSPLGLIVLGIAMDYFLH
jgi:hypothetical protein